MDNDILYFGKTRDITSQAGCLPAAFPIATIGPAVWLIEKAVIMTDIRTLLALKRISKSAV
jgi:hypothetical protein